MLILRRKAGETLVIGDEIRITVMDIYEGGVRLAIDAPKRIPVFRSELLLVADANRDAANTQSGPKDLMGMLSGTKSGGKPQSARKEQRGLKEQKNLKPPQEQNASERTEGTEGAEGRQRTERFQTVCGFRRNCETGSKGSGEAQYR